jgi:cytochrome c biogenesis protein CcmG/thiol:disulfide interchange protein DsbE
VSARAFVVVMAALAVIGLLGFGLATKGEGGIPVGEPLPEAELPRLVPSGGEASLADYEGSWVLANVWASWCNPCRDEAPLLERFAREHRADGVVVVGIDTQDNTDDALGFVDEFGLTYDQLHDGSGDYADDIGTTGVPESILIAPSGDVAYHVPGAVTEPILRDQIEPLIEGKGA